jgi:hypothetical protein
MVKRTSGHYHERSQIYEDIRDFYFQLSLEVTVLAFDCLAVSEFQKRYVYLTLN